MFNDYRLEVDVASIIEDFDNLKIKITMPEGTPNVAAREDIKISDTAPIVRGVEGERGVGELVNRPWSWRGPTGKPVYNRSEEHTSELQSLMRISYAVFCLKKKNTHLTLYSPTQYSY